MHVSLKWLRSVEPGYTVTVLRFAFVIVWVALTSLACAEREHVMTWDEAVPTESTKRLRVEKRNEANRTKTISRGPIPVGDDSFGGDGQPSAIRTPAGIQIDRAITDFRARRAASAKLPRTHPNHSEGWLQLLSAIDDACTVAPTADDLSAFVRARVVIEVEHQRDVSRKRVLPADIDKRVSRSIGGIDSRVAELKLILPDGGGIMSPLVRKRGTTLVLYTPVENPVISSPFGPRTDPLHGATRFHAGLDFAQPAGSTIFASAEGYVIYAGWQGGYGRHVVIDHGDGVRTHYSHMETIVVKAGARVRAGDPIGAVGETGRATGPHLHFAVTNQDGQFLDPAAVLDNPHAFAPAKAPRVAGRMSSR